MACYRRYRRNKHYSQAPRGEGGFEVIMAVRYFAPSVFYRLFIDNNILGSWLEYRAKFSTRRKKECFEARMTSSEIIISLDEIREDRNSREFRLLFVERLSIIVLLLRSY